MVNYIWVGMIVVGVFFGMMNGTMEEVNKAIFEGGKNAVTICIGLISILVFWIGLMKIAEKSGLLQKLVNIFLPITSKLFPEVPKNHPALGFILSNMIANAFGLGNAATPMGIKAMEELRKLNGGKSEATRSMITFLALNTSAVTLIPTTVLSIRIGNHSANPTEIVGVTILAQVVSAVGALLIDRYYYYKSMRKGREK